MLLFPTWAKLLAKFNPKMQDFKRGLNNLVFQLTFKC